MRIKEYNMKKRYTKPTMRVYKLQPHHIICSSPFGVSDLSNSEGFTWDGNGIDGDDY